MQIADLLIPHLISLTNAEALALILGIRERRRFIAKPAKLTKVNTQRSKKDPLDNMTKDQLKQLLEALTT